MYKKPPVHGIKMSATSIKKINGMSEFTQTPCRQGMSVRPHRCRIIQQPHLPPVRESCAPYVRNPCTITENEGTRKGPSRSVSQRVGKTGSHHMATRSARRAWRPQPSWRRNSIATKPPTRRRATPPRPVGLHFGIALRARRRAGGESEREENESEGVSA